MLLINVISLFDFCAIGSARRGFEISHVSKMLLKYIQDLEISHAIKWIFPEMCTMNIYSCAKIHVRQFNTRTCMKLEASFSLEPRIRECVKRDTLFRNCAKLTDD